MRPARPDAPLADHELETLFARLIGARQIALAVSGGADSLALLVAVDRWRRSGRGRPGALVLTVDHRLRAGSAQDAALVRQVAEGRGLPVEILVREGPPLHSDVESAARAARYRLLIAAARRAGATHLLTAHQQDDQAETFLMRLQRGAYAFGLAGMRDEIGIEGAGDEPALKLLRPFLAVRRARLAATTAAAGLVPAADPMNDDRRYLRAHVRAVMPALAVAGVDVLRLTAMAGRMRTLADAIDAAATAFLTGPVSTDRFAVVRFERAVFAALSRDVQARALARLIMAAGGEDYPPRFASLAAECGQIAAFGQRFKRTLGGVVIDALSGGTVRFYREIGRRGLPRVELAPGDHGVWDGRFRYQVSRDAPGGLTLAALGDHARSLTALRPRSLPASAFAALPAIFRGDGPVAVAGIELSEAGGLFPVTMTTYLPQRVANPPLFPDFTSDGG